MPIAAAPPGAAVQVAGSSRFVAAIEAQAARRPDLDLHRLRFDNPAAGGTEGRECELVLDI